MFDYSVLCSNVDAQRRNQVVSLLSEHDIGFKLTSQMPFQMKAGSAAETGGSQSASARRQVRYTISVKERDLDCARRLIQEI